MKTYELKKGMKLWCWWMSRNLYFIREFTNRHGETYFVFEDINDAQFDLTAGQVAKLERRA